MAPQQRNNLQYGLSLDRDELAALEDCGNSCRGASDASSAIRRKSRTYLRRVGRAAQRDLDITSGTFLCKVFRSW